MKCVIFQNFFCGPLGVREEMWGPLHPFPVRPMVIAGLDNEQ